jgi:uncharacterized protein YhdP
VSLARRIWKWTAAVLATIAVLAAILIGGLRVWLEQSKTLVPEIVARVEAQTGLSIAFEHVGARLGAFGPEIVFREARIRRTATGVTLATASAGRVGFDVWRSLWTGRVASLRVALEGARLSLLTGPNGIEIVGADGMGPGNSTPLRPDTVPVGHLLIENGTVLLREAEGQRRAFRIEGFELDLERDPSALALKGRLRLPSSLGGRLAFSGHASGDLSAPDTLAWDALLGADSVRFAGWKALFKDARLPASGYGAIELSGRGTGSRWDALALRLDLSTLVLPADEGAPTHLEALTGELALERSESKTALRARNLTLRSGQLLYTRGEFDLGLEQGAEGLLGFTLRSPELKLEALSALVPLVGDEHLRSVLGALAPAGYLADVDLAARKGEAPGEWSLAGRAHFAGFSVGAYGNSPGLAGLDGELVGNGTSGRIKLSSHHFVLALNEYLAAPVDAQELRATFDWWWRPEGWHLASDDLSASSRDGRGSGKARFLLPTDPEESPRLVLDVRIQDGDVRATRKYLPSRKLPPESVAWLDAAFLGGRLVEGRIEYAGEIRRFPFRDGGGEFRITGHTEGVRVHYAPGWPDIENVTADVNFKNQGFSARATAGAVSGIVIEGGEAAMADYKDAELVASGRVKGDLREGLAFVEASPLSALAGIARGSLTAEGPMSAEIALDLPLKHFADRRVELKAATEHARLAIPAVPVELTDLKGQFTLRNLDLEIPELSAKALGGSLRLEAHATPARNGQHLETIQATGSAAATALAGLVGIKNASYLAGSVDWKAQLRAPHLEWQREEVLEGRSGEPAGAGAPGHEHPLAEGATAAPGDAPETRTRKLLATKWLPLNLHLESNLTGLELRFPAPFAKGAAEARALRADLVLDPGAQASDVDPPRALAPHEGPRPAGLTLRAQLGRDGAVAEWRRKSPGPAEGNPLELRRALLRLGAGAPALRDQPGLYVEGHLPELDLGGWLKVDTGRAPGSPLANLLRGAQLTVDKISVYGYAFQDLAIQLAPEERNYRIDVDGAAAHGTLLVPFDLHGPDPLSFSFERLALGERDKGSAAGALSVDPATLPALLIEVKALEMDKRRFGALSAKLAHTPQGLKLERGLLRGSSFSLSATGEWSGTGAEERCSVTVSAESHDLADTLAAMAFVPTIAGKLGKADGELRWKGGVDAPIGERLEGKLSVAVDAGQILAVQPGAGRVLGLLSLAALPRRLSLDFSDLTDKGFAFDTIRGDFEFRDGSAYTDDLVVKGPAAEIGLAGRTGLKARDYDQTAVVTGHFGLPLAAAGAWAFGPAVGAAVLLASKVFKGPLSGMARGYYRITGPWEKPKVDRINSNEAKSAPPASSPPATATDATSATGRGGA